MRLQLLCSALISASTLCAQGMSARPQSGGRYMNPSLATGLPDVFSTVSPRSDIHRRPPATEMISVQELSIPPKALKEFRRSEKAIQSSDLAAAAAHLQKAIEIDPDFVQARNNLGAAYIEMHKYEAAVDELHKTIALNPKLEAPYSNLGLGLFRLGRLSEAEEAARQGVSMDPSRASSRYTLGRILAMEGDASSATLDMLQQVVAEYPAARLCLAQVYLNQGARDQAAGELRAYLKDASPSEKPAVSCWLARVSDDTKSRACASFTSVAPQSAPPATH
jgi:tetratricopeptide (TPR) repeat protein